MLVAVLSTFSISVFVPWSTLFGGHATAAIPTVQISTPVLGIAAAAKINAEPSAASMANARTQYQRDRDALKRGKPKKEEDVVRALGRDADNSMTVGPNTYLHWYYQTKPILEGRDVLSVVLDDKGQVIIYDR